MAGEILAAIELCEKISSIGLRVHGIAVNVSTNFKEPLEELQIKVFRVSKHVEQIGKDLEKSKTHQLKGVKEVLENIKQELNNVQKFFTKVQRHDGRNWLVKLAIRTKNLQPVQSKIEDFGFLLDNLNNELYQNVPEATFEVVISIDQDIQVLKQQNNFMKQNRELERENAILTEKLRLNASWGEFLKKRAAGDFKIMPSELADEVNLSEINNCIYSTAMLDGEKVVVKRFQGVDKQIEAGMFRREARNLIMFSRGSIVRVLGMCEDEKFLVLEYMEKGTLSKVLEEEKELSLKNKIYLAMTAARSLKRMHLKLVHTALRTEKFLVDSDYTAKLSGMIFAKTLSSCKRYTGTVSCDNIYFYRAQERFHPGILTKATDIYGFGIVLWEIFTQTKPFSSKLQGNDINLDNVIKFVEDKNEEYELNLQDPVNDDLSKLVRRCRSFDPKDRPDISEIEQILSEIYEAFLDREDEEVGL